jgi:hypothetical protein
MIPKNGVPWNRTEQDYYIFEFLANNEWDVLPMSSL